jgi:nucleotide-binding universal stress UspA family protein|tara:strand:+ start:47031 stop:47861 length:831 start_codon:yes stop_codon:yes gene_type:complete
MKKILVPVDFSECSEHALKVASDLAKKYDAEIIALHMMGMTDAVLTNMQTQQMLEGIYYVKLAQKRFKEFLDKDYLQGVSITDAVYNYTDFSEINTVAEGNNVDLIVMGSHGSSGLTEVFVGSNTEKVVRHSEIPVLVVKNRHDNFEIKNGVFACDFTSENLKVFKKAMKLYKSLNAKVTLLYINVPGQNYRSSKEMENRVRDFLFDADAVHLVDDVDYYSDYTVEDGIFNYSIKNTIDTIALPTHGRRGLAHFFSGSISEDLVNHSDIPVITFKI